MVATIKALGGSPVAISKYLELDQIPQYYSGMGSGRWHGRVRDVLRLPSRVTVDVFERLLLGQNHHGKPLVRRVASRTIREGKGKSGEQELKECLGYDITFSAEKSLSAVWACADEATREEIKAAMLGAVEQTMHMFCQTMPLARRGRGGRTRIHADLACASFWDTLSRAGEPQLHIHCIVPNVCLGADKRWSAVNSRLLHQWTPVLGRMFRCELAVELRRRLGVELVRPQRPDGELDAWFRLEGVPQSLTDAWSSRSRTITEAAPHMRGRKGSAAAKARQQANYATRGKKQKQASEAELLAEFAREGRSHGFGPREVQRVLQRRTSSPIHRTPQEVEAEIGEAFRLCTRRLTISQAHFSERAVIQDVCESLQHREFRSSDIIRHVRRTLEHSPAIVRLRELGSEPQFTTQEMWQLESQLLQDIDTLRNSFGAEVRDRHVRAAIKADRDLTAEQAKAVEDILCSTSGIRTVHGAAGTGKSRTMNAVRNGFERAGYQVLGGALSGAAKEELAKQAKIASRTVASYLYHLDKSLSAQLHDRLMHEARMLVRAALGKPTYRMPTVELTKKSVLIVDEAGMLDTSTLSRLVAHVKRAGATLLLVGDWKQLPPIQAGGPLKTIAANPTAKLTENRRQLDPRDRQAVADLAAGNVAAAIDNYVARGRLTISPDHHRNIQRLVERWARHGVRSPRDHMIFTQTRRDADEVNRQCQALRRKHLRVIPALRLTHGSQSFQIGDRVLFHQAYRLVGVENGHFATIRGLDLVRRRLLVRLDDPPMAESRKQKVPRTVWIALKQFGADKITLGYAATTHKMQGRTVEHAYILLDGYQTSREMLYTQATRARRTTRFFANRQMAGPELKELIRMADRSAAKLLAHELRSSEPKPDQKSHTKKPPRSKRPPTTPAPRPELRIERDGTGGTV